MSLPGESQGWGGLVGCRLWGRTESGMTDAAVKEPATQGRLQPPLGTSVAPSLTLTLLNLSSVHRFLDHALTWEGILSSPLPSLVFHGSSYHKESACNAGDPSLIPWLGRSPGEGYGNPLLYSCLENPMDRGP